MSLEYRLEVAEAGNEYAIAVGSMESINAILSNLDVPRNATLRVWRQKDDELVLDFCAAGLSELA